jgi:hypothetical protein
LASGSAEAQLIGGRAGAGGGAGSLGPVTNGAERTRWKIRSDRTVNENPRIRPTREREALARIVSRLLVAHAADQGIDLFATG